MPPLLLLLLCMVWAASALRNVTVCVPTGGVHTPGSLHVQHAVTYYGRGVPGVSFRVLPLPLAESSSSRDAIVLPFLTHKGSCDAYVGPGTSSNAVALSPFVQVPWLDYASTSTELSDKEHHPFFSRVIPSDAVGARVAADFLAHLGWSAVAVVYGNDPYGRSLFGAFEAEVRRHGGAVVAQHRISPVPLDTELADLGRRLPTLPTRIVYVAAYLRAPEMARLRTALQQCHDCTFVFPETACSRSDAAALAFPAALCLTYAAPDPSAAALLDFAATTADRDPPQAVPTSLFSAMAHDAGRLLVAHFAAAPALSRGEPLDAVVRLRSLNVSGLTGALALDAAGERRAPPRTIVWRVEGGALVAAAALDHDGGRFAVSATNQTSMAALRAVVPGRTVPSKDGMTAAVGAAIAAGAVAAVACVVVGAVFAGLRCCGRHEHAPTDARRGFAVVFTDVESSTVLWARSPAAMSKAVGVHHAALRGLMHQHRGYEVKSVGDGFMVAFKDPSDAVVFAAETQGTLHAAAWGTPVLEEEYRRLWAERREELPLDAEADHALRAMTDPTCWRGLRVRVGVHYGTGTIVHDPVTGRYDYYGTVVNVASRVCDLAHGGQVLATSDAVDATGGSTGAMTLGPQWLRGVAAPVEVLQLPVVPALEAARCFPELRPSLRGPPPESAAETESPLPLPLLVPEPGPAGLEVGEVDAIVVAALETALQPMAPSELRALLAAFARRWHVPLGPGTVAAVGRRVAAVVSVHRGTTEVLWRSPKGSAHAVRRMLATEPDMGAPLPAQQEEESSE